MSQNSDGTGAAAVDGPVGRILDKSGRGNHALQSIAAARPLLRQDGIKRLYLEFDGADDRLVSNLSMPQPFDRISAIRQIGWALNDLVFSCHSSDFGALYQNPIAPTLLLYDGAGDPSRPQSAELAVGMNGIVVERFAGANSRLAISNGAYVSGSLNGNAIAHFSIGARSGGGGASSIRLYGVLAIGRLLSAAETMRVRRFMAARAGVSL